MLYDVWVNGKHEGRVIFNPWNNVDDDPEDKENLGGSAVVRDPNVNCVLVMVLVSEEPQENGLMKRVYKVVE